MPRETLRRPITPLFSWPLFPWRFSEERCAAYIVKMMGLRGNMSKKRSPNTTAQLPFSTDRRYPSPTARKDRIAQKQRQMEESGGRGSNGASSEPSKAALSKERKNRAAFHLRGILHTHGIHWRALTALHSIRLNQVREMALPTHNTLTRPACAALRPP